MTPQRVTTATEQQKRTNNVEMNGRTKKSTTTGITAIMFSAACLAGLTPVSCTSETLYVPMEAQAFHVKNNTAEPLVASADSVSESRWGLSHRNALVGLGAGDYRTLTRTPATIHFLQIGNGMNSSLYESPRPLRFSGPALFEIYGRQVCVREEKEGGRVYWLKQLK